MPAGPEPSHECCSRNHRVSDRSRPTLAAGRRRSHQSHIRARSGRDRDGRPRPFVGRSSTPGLDARALERAHASGPLDCASPLAAADCEAAEFGFADASASRATPPAVVRGYERARQASARGSPPEATARQAPLSHSASTRRKRRQSRMPCHRQRQPQRSQRHRASRSPPSH